MRFKRKKRAESLWVLVAGVVLTGAAAAYVLSRVWRSAPIAGRRDVRALEKRIVQALLNDEIASSQGIDVSGVGPGVVELSGTIDTQEAARHIVSVVDAVPGVHAVLNRLEIHTIESRLQKNRTHNGADGARWYGGGVGMGRRRQSPATDPSRRDDHVSLLMHAQQPNRDETLSAVEEAEGNGVRIGLSASGLFSTNVAPHAPDAAEEQPGPPPAVAPHDAAQRQ